ncbi:hypothetical protein Trydic_g8098 [Trypoxylus dichotomus]
MGSGARKRAARTEENTILVQEAMVASPTKTTHRFSLKTNISHRDRILRRDLGMKPYHLQIVNVWGAVSKLGVIGPFFFEEQTVGEEKYFAIFSTFLEENVALAIFQRGYSARRRPCPLQSDGLSLPGGQARTEKYEYGSALSYYNVHQIMLNKEGMKRYDKRKEYERGRIIELGLIHHYPVSNFRYSLHSYTDCYGSGAVNKEALCLDRYLILWVVAVWVFLSSTYTASRTSTSEPFVVPL